MEITIISDLKKQRCIKISDKWALKETAQGAIMVQIITYSMGMSLGMKLIIVQKWT